MRVSQTRANPEAIPRFSQVTVPPPVRWEAADRFVKDFRRPAEYSGRATMADLPNTRPSLLVRLRQRADQEAWREFVGLYAPLIYGFGRKHGLQDADASDLTQEV